MQRDVMAQFQEQGKDVLGHGEGAIFRDIRDRDTPAPGRREIHAIVPRRRHGDEPKLR